MKHYENAVRRRLRLPRKLRNRVMADFISSIEGRREAGCSDAEIMAELGSPRAAADNLNRQMEEFTYRKSPWRWACLAPLCLSILLLSHSVLFFLEAASVGAIGGADGPTVIFVTGAAGPRWPAVLSLILVLALALWGFWKLGHLKQK